MKTVKFEKSLKGLPFIVAVGAFVLMLCQWIAGINLMTLINVFFLLVMTAVILISVLVKKKVYLWYVVAYGCAAFAVFSFYTVAGADSGWGAITTGKIGFLSAKHPLWTGEGNFWTRLAGNALLILPSATILGLIVFFAIKIFKSSKVKLAVVGGLCALLMVSSLIYFFTMNLRAKPKVFSMKEGHDDYLNNVKENASSPNVLFILLDDLGYGDTSYNGAIYDTPNIDSIAENGLNFENFYAAYSVCSPSRFAAMTGRYPYRGYADNVVYPTTSTFSPYANTRVFNSFEMGANVDGLLGDEITIAEVLSRAGYATGAFGKWHLGDYGEYLPTNQGFDYFYGSHYVNDMTPFYHVEEENGEYEIAVGIEELKDQSSATKLINERMFSWLEDTVNGEKPFFMYYASPWPHAPVFAGEEYQGSTGMGIYADCVHEIDDYLGLLFDKMDKLGVLDDTIIVFTSDNGPALQGSTADLRGGKYTAYEGGQKVPFYMRWDNNGGLFEKGSTVSAPAVLTDLFPTVVELCGIESKDGKKNYLPSDVDREMDGVSMVPAISDKNVYLHGSNNPILYMKRESIKSVSYSVTKEYVLNQTADYIKENHHAEGAEYLNYDILKGEGYVSFKYFRNMQNDNPAFFDKRRKNWLHILTDDVGENYNRSEVYPDMASEMNAIITEWTKKFKNNRRGIYKEYYK